jgi:hypothetical protein
MSCPHALGTVHISVPNHYGSQISFLQDVILRYTCQRRFNINAVLFFEMFVIQICYTKIFNL